MGASTKMDVAGGNDNKLGGFKTSSVLNKDSYF